jgi:hypothetical protein
MTPHEYKELYRNLLVPIVNEKDERTGWQKVDVNRYLLTNQDNKKGEPEHYNIQNSKNGLGTLYGKLHTHFAKPGASIKVYVGSAELDERVFKTFYDVWYYANKAFWGKGSPEEIQITLQLVLRFKLATPQTLQAYCDEKTDGLAQGRVGLDCNGFVGNYLEHGHRGGAWDGHKVGFQAYEANTDIATIMSKLGPEVKSLNDINIHDTYVMGLVDPTSKRVIARFSGGSTGHIVISTPFTFIATDGVKRNIKMNVVESTLDAGLVESEYMLLSGKDYVFTVSRGSKKGTIYEKMNVRMRPVR